MPVAVLHLLFWRGNLFFRRYACSKRPVATVAWHPPSNSSNQFIFEIARCTVASTFFRGYTLNSGRAVSWKYARCSVASIILKGYPVFPEVFMFEKARCTVAWHPPWNSLNQFIFEKARCTCCIYFFSRVYPEFWESCLAKICPLQCCIYYFEGVPSFSGGMHVRKDPLRLLHDTPLQIH